MKWIQHTALDGTTTWVDDLDGTTWVQRPAADTMLHQPPATLSADETPFAFGQTVRSAAPGRGEIARALRQLLRDDFEPEIDRHLATKGTLMTFETTDREQLAVLIEAAYRHKRAYKSLAKANAFLDDVGPQLLAQIQPYVSSDFGIRAAIGARALSPLDAGSSLAIGDVRAAARINRRLDAPLPPFATLTFRREE